MRHLDILLVHYNKCRISTADTAEAGGQFKEVAFPAERLIATPHEESDIRCRLPPQPRLSRSPLTPWSVPTTRCELSHGGSRAVLHAVLHVSPIWRALDAVFRRS